MWGLFVHNIKKPPEKFCIYGIDKVSKKGYNKETEIFPINKLKGGSQPKG